MKPITIQDVADRAQVSRATVSRVMNNHPNVASDIRSRVQEAMRDLGYNPNRAARRLRGNSNDVIGLIIPDIQNPVFVAVARGVEDAAYRHQINVLLCNSDDHADKQQAYLNVMLAERAAGLIIVPTHARDGKTLVEIRNAGLPIVLLDRQVQRFEADTVKTDNVLGARIIVNHLLELGRSRIALIGGLQYLTPARERYQGYVEALRDAGRDVDESLIINGDFKAESGYRITRELMALASPPDAIFTTNSLMAMGALKALHELHIRVPQDVALVSFDDVPWAENLNPPLTAVVQPAYELGVQAVELLRKRFTEPDAPIQTVMLQPTLIVRESCGASLNQPREQA